MTYLDDLERLNQLKNRGIISKEAYEQKKNIILSKYSDWQTDAESEQKSPNITKRTFIALLLAVGAFVAFNGYKEMMRRHRANLILDYVSRCAVIAQTMGDGYTIGNYTKEWNEEKRAYETFLSDTTCQELMHMEPAPLNLYSGDFIVYAAQTEDKFFKIETPPIQSAEIRQALLSRNSRYVEIRQLYNNGMEFIFQK